jgi:hypothetical protein
MTHDELRERVTLYFDGELPAAEEPAVLDHLATCEDCQRELGDAMAIHALVETPPPAAIPIRAARSRRYARPLVAGGLAAAAAVVAVLAWPRGDDGSPREPTLALAPTRSLEVRFTAPAFAAHRPYDVTRAGPGPESIPLEMLAELERRGDSDALLAALASSGDLVRARSLADRAPGADRAALALLGGRFEDALELATDDTAPAARWNFALAARELGLVALAADRFQQIATAGEAGWGAEATRRANTLTAERAREHGLVAYRARAAAMVAGGAPITDADLAQYPGPARIAVLDALRTSRDPAELARLDSLVAALDRAAGNEHVRAFANRIARTDFEIRAKFRERYLALTTGTFDYAQSDALLDELKRAGPDVEDLYAGAILFTGQATARVADLRARTHGDPWLELLVENEQLRADFVQHGAPAVHARARAALDRCGDVWAYRCAQLALATSGYASDVGLNDEARDLARRARDHAVAAGAVELEADALAFMGEIERMRGRRAIARALFEEVELRGAKFDCRLVAYVRIGRAKIALVDGNLALARELMRALDKCARPDEVAVEVAIDLARMSGAAEDRELANTWITVARSSRPRVAVMADVAAARLAIVDDPAAATTLRDWIARHPATDTPTYMIRAWATDALIAAAGERGDWSAAADDARAEVGLPSRDHCTVVASVDQDRQTVALRGADGRWTGRARRESIGTLDAATFVPRDLTKALVGCARIDVLARPPLHGKTTLLPPELPWVFVGEPPRASPPRAWRAVIVADAMPPDAALQLPRLDPQATPSDATVIRGAAATPARVLAEVASASYVELVAHGIADLASSDAAFLALSPEPGGRFALTGADIRKAKLGGAVVVLAACRATRVAPYLHRRWTLPDAFLAAGARTVIATDIDIPDRDATAVFADLRRRIAAGEPPATALAAIRSAAIARDPKTWVSRVAVFE